MRCFILKLAGFSMPFLSLTSCLARSALCNLAQLSSKIDVLRIHPRPEQRAASGTLLICAMTHLWNHQHCLEWMWSAPLAALQLEHNADVPSGILGLGSLVMQCKMLQSQCRKEDVMVEWANYLALTQETGVQVLYATPHYFFTLTYYFLFSSVFNCSLVRFRHQN